MSSLVNNIFTQLKADECFIKKVDVYIASIMKDGKIDQNDVPQIIFLIMDVYNQLPQFHLSYEDLPQLIKLLYNFIIEKLIADKKITLSNDEIANFEKLVDISINLVMLQPIVKKQVTKCFSFFSCINKTSAIPSNKL